jgi:nucleoid DNA-binding protein
VWADVLGLMRKALVKGRCVTLLHVGTIEPYMKKASRYLHPQNRVIRRIPRRWHVRFLMSPTLKQKLRDLTE